ncbi:MULTISPECIES: translation initiation factor IF-3 [Cetobacterium]|uniref:Translation initiation factor IF-3 n=1 Tax=Candidatus Cetobacterium colombiensis TaxID=3073100 RepID=A0ABU4WAA6_9FUSO|nr:translation initiation factor IF-3 [Candidatus Cetobacterium colombiensis]MDX8336451.1 translation initiation factor IF-3 [Candidatus Cetobacterium colombiensis]
MSIISDKVRINEKIRGRELRIISETGEQLGIMSSAEALELAMQKELDLVEISPNAAPPVCKIMDYGKYKYEQTRKAKEAKKNQKQVIVKEVKFRARIDQHDMDTKIAQVKKFLEKDNKVKITLVQYGRERMYADQGIEMLDQISERFVEVADVDKKYNDKQKYLILSPKK